MFQHGGGKDLGRDGREPNPYHEEKGQAPSARQGQIKPDAPIEAALLPSQYFPIFVNLGGVPPLVIGDAPELVAKIGLLLKFAPAFYLEQRVAPDEIFASFLTRVGVAPFKEVLYGAA